MITLDIDSETFEGWRKQASDCGMTVEEWLKKRLNVEPESAQGDALLESNDDWQEWLSEFAMRHQATGHPMDDSRESIYD